MTFSAALALAFGALAVTCLAATGVKCVRKFSRYELEALCRQRGNEGLLRDVLLHHHAVAVAIECLEMLAASTLVCAVYGLLLLSTGQSAPLELGTLAVGAAVSTVLLGFAAIGVPWAVARVWSVRFVYHSWPAWRALARLLTPAVALSRWVDGLLHRLAGRVPEVPTNESIEEEIRTIVAEGHREGLLEEDAREMIEGVIELGAAEVSQIMTPRTFMSSMNVDLPLDEAVAVVMNSGHTRIPVFDKSRDDIVGVLHMKDLLPELVKPPAERGRSIGPFIRKAHFVPETMPLDHLLNEFQRTRNHLAIVLDEYGGVSGLVTIEDVLEEIVGEIDDEYDELQGDGIKTVDERTADVLARVHIDEVNERLGVRLREDGDFDTIGGFVFSHLGHIPAVGEQVVTDNVRITVMDVTRRRIERVRIEALDPSSPEPAA